ncbi:MAG: Ig-like domain-containing protein, partial [Clostridia bacterium]|nr:Ig-like domain-containing protein [Clostridia bacterium]
MKKFFSSFGKWIAAHKAAAISVAAVAVAAVVGVVLVFALKPAISDPVPITAEITPTVADADGVFTESQFLIAGERFADKEDLLSQLSAGVDTPFDVQKTEQGNYLLTFEEPLEPDAILTFMIDDGNGNDRSYAFQTRAEFGVRSFFPRNGASADPTTGIEITFTNADFTDYESYITGEPATPYRMEKVGDRVVIIPEKRWEEMTTYVVTVRAGLTDAKGESIAEDASAEFSISEDVDKNTMIARSGSLEETFLTTDVPVIEMIADTHSYVNADFDYSSAKFDVVVHKVASADAYADLLRVKEAKDVYRRGYYYATYMTYDSVDTAGMEQTLKATLNPIPYEAGSYSTCYLVLPQTLPEGYYVVTATTTLKGTPYTIQKLIQ